MKKSPKFLLVLGILGTAATIFNFFNSPDNWYMNLISLIASVSLIYGYYYTLNQAEKEDHKSKIS